MGSSVLRFLGMALLGPGSSQIEPQGPCRIRDLLGEAWREPTFGIVRLIRLLLLCSLFLFPTIYIDALVGTTRRSVVAASREVYYGSILIVLVAILFLGWHESTLAVVVAVYLLAGILLHLAGQVFAWKAHSVDRERSAILAIMNFFETLVAFAILYRHWDCLSVRQPSATQALYFSLVTGTTVGYGDITPVGTAGHILVMFQLGAVFLFVTVFLSALLTRAGETPPGSVV